MNQNMLEYIIFLMKYASNFTLDAMVTLILLDLGIPVKDAGFLYLKNAILLYYENPSRLIVKEIYPAAAQMCGFYAESAAVEQAIRRSISFAWTHRNQRIWCRYFLGWMRESKPANADFIAYVAVLLTVICTSWEYSRKQN